MLSVVITLESLTLTLTVEQLELVRCPIDEVEPARRDEWTEIWNVIWVEVFDRVTRVTSWAMFHWPISSMRDDFVSHYLLSVVERARSGRLLANFALEPGDDPLEAVVSYLCSPRVLLNRARRFVAREVIGNRLAADPSAVPISHDAELVERAIADLLSRLAEDIGKGIRQPHQTAGFELFPRVTAEHDPEELDLSALIANVLAAVDTEDAVQAKMKIDDAHTEAQQSIQQELLKQTAKLYNRGHGRSGQVANRLRDKIAGLHLASWLWPLDATTMSALTGVPIQTMYTYIGRYRGYLKSSMKDLVEKAGDAPLSDPASRAEDSDDES